MGTSSRLRPSLESRTFGGKSGWWQVLSAIYKVSGAVVPTGSTAANVITALSEETLPDGGSADDGVSKPRDAYGKQLDSRDGAFAEEEGGIVVCMPNRGGPHVRAWSQSLHQRGSDRGSQRFAGHEEQLRNAG